MSRPSAHWATAGRRATWLAWSPGRGAASPRTVHLLWTATARRNNLVVGRRLPIVGRAAGDSQRWECRWAYEPGNVRGRPFPSVTAVASMIARAMLDPATSASILPGGVSHVEGDPRPRRGWPAPHAPSTSRGCRRTSRQASAHRERPTAGDQGRSGCGIRGRFFRSFWGTRSFQYPDPGSAWSWNRQLKGLLRP
jgi:hypothetical protein